MLNLHWVRFVFSPDYFSGIDSLLEILTVVISLLIAYYSYRCFKFCGEVKYRHFSWAFLAICAAFLFKILTNITIYYQVLETIHVGRLDLEYLSIKTSELFYIIGYFLHRTLFFFGLLGIWMSVDKISSRKLLLLMAWFIFVINYVSHYAYFAFHVTTLILLLFITSTYWENQQKANTKTSRMVTGAFALLAISQLFFILEWITIQLYVIGTIIQTIAFLLLLYMYLLVSRK